MTDDRMSKRFNLANFMVISVVVFVMFIASADGLMPSIKTIITAFIFHVFLIFLSLLFLFIFFIESSPSF